jgi:rfaE bifunctional protein kinase chain/domain
MSLPSDFWNQVTSLRLLVVGDVMLDRYWFGDVHRISPEAPVPVVLVQRTEERPGGAANVARNISTLGAQCRLLSITGEDEAAGVLKKLLEAANVEATLLSDPSLKTTVKLRVLGRQQQLLRLDFETQPNATILQDKLTMYSQLLHDVDAVILSDYGKGGLEYIQEMIRQCRSQRIPVLVDPKGEDYSRYKGASLITPNRAELRQVIGPWANESEMIQKAEKLRQQLELEAVLITRSEEGMTLIQENQITHDPAQAQEVFDVSGAGDTVIAVMGLGVAAHLSLKTSMQLANRAAGVVVGKLGTAVVTPAEIKNVFS